MTLLHICLAISQPFGRRNFGQCTNLARVSDIVAVKEHHHEDTRSVHHLLCIKRRHLFATLPERFGGLGEALKLSVPLQAGLGPEVLVLGVFCVLILWRQRCCRLLLLLNTEQADTRQT